MALERPPAAIARNVEAHVPGAYEWLYQQLEAIHRDLPATATSWWRSKAKNASVGGAADSQHLLGLAIDIVYPSSLIRRTAIPRLQAAGFTVIDEGDHVHVQVFRAQPAVSELIRAFAR